MLNHFMNNLVVSALNKQAFTALATADEFDALISLFELIVTNVSKNIVMILTP
jgi:hypothetical protein